VLGSDGERPPEIRLEPILWVPRPSPAAVRRARRRRQVRRLRWGVAAVVGLVLLLAGFAALPAALPDAPVIASDGYRRQADLACAAGRSRLTGLPEPDEDASPDERADAVSSYIDEVEGLAGELRALAVVPEGGLRSWLDDWDAYVASGRSYVAAARLGDLRGLQGADDDSRRILRRIDTVAVANGMGDCAIGIPARV
jgi:hypothetical protein